MISGSKGGQPKPHVPYEMEDNLISINKIKVLLAVSDGECDPDFSLKDLLLDDVPVMNEDGTYNYNGVTAEYRPGTQTQDYIKGFTDTSSETTVAREISTTTPYVISVTNKTLSAIRIKILMPQGLTIKDNGDRVGVEVTYRVEMAVDGDSYKEVFTDVIKGKTTSGYDRSRRIDLPTFNDQVLLRVSRVTDDSTSTNVSDRIQLQSYAEVVDAKFRYPLTGLVFVEFDSELFPSRMPNISIRKKWKIINVPSNYDPDARTYNGAWDGTWKKAWSNNPAFILYDLITNQRYGLDQRELGIALDKWSIYEAAQYCDQMVPDGKGGTEPRYLCDVVIQSQIEAYQLIRDICSIFRGMSFWNGESLSIVVDKPREPSYIFTNDNVVNGDFSYTFASEKSMYTQCNVMFDDEQNLYQQDSEGVFEAEAAMRFGHNPTSITAIGCTRRSEANRRGRWVLKTNLRSTTVNFATGLEGMIPSIGDVVAIADNFWSSNLTLNLSGRLMEVSGLQVFLPFKVDARPGDFIVINRPDGKPVKRTIANISSDGKTIELNVGYNFDVAPDTVFAIDRTDIALQQYVVTTITKGDGDDEFTYSITAVEYDPNKYDEIDYGVNIDDRPTSIVQPDVMPAPENVKVSSYSRIVQGMSVETMHVSWDKVEYAALYEMQWRKDNGNWHNTPQTANKETEVEGIYAGNYFVRVRSVSAGGSASPWSKVVNASLTGKVGEPGKPINVTASDNETWGIRVKWGFAEGSGDTDYTEIQQAPDVDGKPLSDGASLLAMVPYPQYEYWHSILPNGYINWYRARTVDKIGNVSEWSDFVRGQASTNVDDILGDILDDILNSDEFQDFKENATASANKIKDTAQAIIQNALANDADVKWTRKENGKRKAEYGQAVQLIADERQARVTAIEELRASVGDNIGSSIKEVKEAIANEEEARAQAVQGLNTKFTKEIGDLSTNVDGKINGVKGDINVLRQETNSSIGRVDQAISNETQARAQAVTSLDAKLTQQIKDLDKVVEKEISSNISRVEQAIATEKEARATADTALSSRIGKNESALTQKLDSWANVGSVGAKYQVKLGLTYNGVQYSSGMQMTLTGSGSNIKSQILFDAGRFGVLNSTSGAYVLPFVIEANQVYMNSALIKNGMITNAMIGNEIKSNNYVAGKAGWRILKDGNAEFSNATFRGTVYASAGSFTGAINATSGKFKGTVEAESFVGDVVNAGVGPDKVREVAGTVKANITYRDSAATNKPKTVIVQAMITARAPRTGQDGILGIYATCNGVRKEIPYVACPSVSPTVIPVHFAFTGITAQVVNVEIGTNNRSGQTEASAHSIYAPTVMIARGSGSFSYS